MYRTFLSLVVVLFAPVALGVAACSIQRAQTASAAQTAMIGLSKADILACLGAPQTKATEGHVEVWGYQSGNGRSDSYSNTSKIAVGTAESKLMGNTTYAAAAAAGGSQTSSFG